MTRPWWDRPGAAASIEKGAPILLPGGRKALLEALRSRIPGFTPEWRDLGDEDAGVALIRLFGAQIDPIARRADRLTEKALHEFLRTAGISLAPPRSASAFVRFEPKPKNDGPVLVPPGFRLSSPRSDGGPGDAVWETRDPLSVGNIALAEILAFDGASIRPTRLGEAFRPFGERPAAGAALYLGFAVVGTPGPTLSLLFEAASEGDPAPVSEGGAPPASVPRPALRWEALTGRGFAAVDVARDDSAQASRTGIALLKLPDDWAAGRPAAAADGPPLHWLRLRLASGEMRTPLRLANIHPHVVEAEARETHREEFPVPEPAGRGSIARLARSPVLQDSVVLEVDEGVAGAGLLDLEDEDDGEGGGFRRWALVDTLAGQRPDARVFTLDSAEGIIRFGDQREGMAPPPGIRNIAVRSYATTLGAAANVGAEAISGMASALAGIQSVSNPLPASGGSDLETIESAVALGPARVKARERAVTADDVALLATEAEGADIIRAYALPCGDPAFPGAVRPGTTGVFVIARRHPRDRSSEPPLASSETLAAVAAHLSGRSAPLGARIVVANPRFHRILVQGTIAVAEGRDSGAAMSAAGDALDRYLNPELGGWSIGASIRHSALVHVVLGASPDIVSVPFLSVTVDGIVHSACTDVALSCFGLPWPGRHRLLALAEGSGQ